jgi:tight adherence protein B
MQEALALASLAVVLAIGAVLLWRHADRRARRAASSAFLESQLQRGRDEAAADAPFAENTREFRSGFSGWDRLLRLAGLRQSAGLYVRIALPVVVGAALAWTFLGALSGAAARVPGQHRAPAHHRQQHGRRVPDGRRRCR